MTPDDVPDELVKPFAEQLLSDYDEEFNAAHLTWKDFAGQARKLLAMILPVHEQMVRAKVAEEITELLRAAPDHPTAYLRLANYLGDARDAARAET